MTPCIICVAITGSLPTKAHNPAVPITIEEQIDSACEAFEAGASIVHLHVRNADESPSSDPEKFAAFKEGMGKACPEMIIQFSTGGRSGAGRQRGGMLCHAPDMASLTVGSNNFPNRVYDNEPALIDWLAAEMQRYQIKPELEIFDLSHLFKAKDMLEQGQLSENPYMQFVMGVKNAMPADRQVFDFYIQTAKRLFGEEVMWCAAGIGAQQLVLNKWCVEAGGHARCGLEDNVRLDRHTLAPSNAALVKRVVECCEDAGRTVATAAEARQMLGLNAVS